MERARKKQKLWLVNRLFLRAVWLSLKGAWLAAKHLGPLAWKGARATAAASRKSPAIASKLKPRDGKGPRHSNAGIEELTPVKAVAGNYLDFSRSLAKKSLIVLIFGRRGSGKSALGFRLMENIHAGSKRPCFALGVSKALLPDWISETGSLDSVEHGSVVLVDEGAIAFSARESMQKKNVTLGKLLAVARHKDLTLVFITQNTGMVDKYVLNLTDVIIAKEGSLLQKQMERPAVRELMEKVENAMQAIPKDARVRHCYVLSDDFEGLCSVKLPGFWTEKISKSQA